jgi:hypothetical protein
MASGHVDYATPKGSVPKRSSVNAPARVNVRELGGGEGDDRGTMSVPFEGPVGRVCDVGGCAVGTGPMRVVHSGVST